MSIAISEGVLGLEAEHRISGVILNPNAAGYPRISVQRIPNFHGLAEIEDVYAATRGRIGRIAYPVNNQGKVYVYEARVEAYSRASMRGLANSMRGALADRWSARMIRSVPHPELAAGGSAAAGWYAYGRVIDLPMDDEQLYAGDHNPTPWKRGFTMSVHLFNPRWYLYGGEVEDTDPDTVVVDNQGNAPTDPVISVAGAGGTVTVKRNSDDVQLRFTGLPSGTLLLNFARRTAAVDGDDVSGRLDTANSEWWDEGVTGLNPGADSVVLVSGGSSITVTYTPASW